MQRIIVNRDEHYFPRSYINQLKEEIEDSKLVPTIKEITYLLDKLTNSKDAI